MPQVGTLKYECPSNAHYAEYTEVDKHQAIVLISYVETHNSKKEEVVFGQRRKQSHEWRQALVGGARSIFLALSETQK